MTDRFNDPKWWAGYISGASKTRVMLGATAGNNWDILQKQAAALAGKKIPVFIPIVEGVKND